jgi:hypothetical protein
MAANPLTMLDAHIPFYAQLAEHGRAANGTRPRDLKALLLATNEVCWFAPAA